MTNWPSSRRLIEVPDPDLYAALIGDKMLPPECHRRAVRPHQGVSRLRTTTYETGFEIAGRAARPGRALTLANVAEGAEGLVVSDLARAIAARPKQPAVSLAVVCRDGARMQQLARAL